MSTGKALFLDCPPFLHELYEDGLDSIVPDLAVHVGSPTREEAIGLIAGHAFVMNDHTQMDAAFLAACPDLKAIVFLGTGAASFIDVEAAGARGIAVRSYKGYGDQSVAEHALALMLASGRQIAAMDRDTRKGVFEPMNGIEFAGRTLGVIGTGGVGQAMIRLAAGIGMKVVAWNRSGVPQGLPCEAVDLDQLLGRADVVSVHLSLSDETTGFLSAERIARIKPGAIVVNTARGAVLDEAALIDALREGRVAHAGLDVFDTEPLPADHPLCALGNVTLTSHAAFMTREASVRLLRMALEILAEERAR